MKGIRNILLGLLAAAILAACAQTPVAVSNQEAIQQPEAAQTYTPDKPTQEPTYTPTATLEPTATSTPTAIPLEGRLFFDMNGSGLRDMASFIYDAERLTDERQPLHPDLLAAITAYINEHPELQDGDLITLEEPGLSNYTVCAKDICSTTAADGSFVLPGATQNSYLNITDPNAGTPALEMRYINKWNKAVTVPAYTKDVDAATMGTLAIVPGCEEDAEALVCKLDGDTLQVRDQHLNDTMVLPISDKVQVVKNGEIGLMQGFLTLPFKAEQISKPFIWNYFDIIGHRIFDDNNNYFSTQEGVMLNYNGLFNAPVSSSNFGDLRIFQQLSGVGDSHTGLDYLVPVGNLVISGAPTSQVWYYPSGQINLMLQVVSDTYDNCYGHMSAPLLELNQKVYRGQIVGLSGNVGDNWFIPQLHFHIANAIENGWYYLDPYRYIVDLDPLPTNFWGNSVSMWSNDNNPIFPASIQP